ncbi:MAG: hypothetical protein CVV50_04435, partial [Spirochaetae bacterium HGW-Spirochaetae-6]
MRKLSIKLVLVLIGIFLIFSLGIKNYIQNDVDLLLQDNTLLYLQDALSLLGEKVPADMLSNLEKRGFRVTKITLEGDVLYDSALQKIDENLLYKEEFKKNAAYRFDTNLGKHYYFATRRFSDSYLRIGRPADEAPEKKLLLQFYKYFFFGAVILGLVALLFMESIFGSLKEILHFTKSFGSGNYQARINYFGGGDMEVITASLNDMARTIKQNYAELKSREDVIETVILNFPLGVALLDSKGRIELCNPQLEILLGTTIKQGKMYYENFFHSRVIETIKASYDSQDTISVKIPFISLEREAIYELSCHHVESKVLLVIIDISEKEKLNMLKDQFISDVTHEFKTPISIILGYTEIIETRLAGKELTYIQKIKGALGRLTEIIHDLVKLEKIEHAHLFGNLEKLSIDAILSRAAELLFPLAERKGITLEMNISEPSPTLQGAEEILYHCFYNLIENAIKYHDKEKGKVEITVRQDDEMVEISVCDNGP